MQLLERDRPVRVLVDCLVQLEEQLHLRLVRVRVRVRVRVWVRIRVNTQ